MIQPIDQLVAGTTDATGSFTSPVLKPVPTLWGALKAVIQAGGSGRWAVIVAGTPKAYGRGERIDIPILVQPSQSVQIQLTGASPNTAVIGVLTGVGGTTLDEVAPYISLVPNTIAVDTSAPELYLGRVIAPGSGAFGSATFVLPPNTYALALLSSGTVGGAHISDVNVTGAVTHNTYANINSTVFPGGLPNDVIYVPIGTAVFDTSVTVSFDVSAAGGQPFVDVVAMLAPIAIAATIAGIGTTPIPSAGQDTSNPSQQSIPVVPAQFYQPTPWQAPSSVVSGFAAGATTTLLAGAAGQVIRNWDGVVEVNTGAAGTQSSVKDSAGNVLAQFSSVAVQNFSCGFIAKPCAVAASLQLQAAAGVTVVYSGGVSQA